MVPLAAPPSAQAAPRAHQHATASSDIFGTTTDFFGGSSSSNGRGSSKDLLGGSSGVRGDLFGSVNGNGVGSHPLQNGHTTHSANDNMDTNLDNLQKTVDKLKKENEGAAPKMLSFHTFTL